MCLAFITAGSAGATGTRDLARAADVPTFSWTETLMPPTPSRRGVMLAAAHGYLAAGRSVFVLGRTKRPVANCPACQAAPAGHDPAACACLTCHGFYAATTDPERVTAMLDAVPGGLLAIRTGAASGLVVIDIDPRHGGQVDQALMAPTMTVATGGGGWHLYYTHPGRPVPSRPLPGHPGVDVKGDGGYVVAPPSVHPGTGHAYEPVSGRWAAVEMHPGLLAACLPPPPPAPTLPAATATAGPATRPVTSRPGGGCISDPAALLAAHLAAVARAPEGRRRRTLYGAARGVARMVAAGAVTPTHAWSVLTAAGRDAGQTDAQTRNAIIGGFTAEHVPPPAAAGPATGSAPAGEPR